MDEIVASVNLLSMSDETLLKVMNKIKELNPTPPKTKGSGLDEWL